VDKVPFSAFSGEARFKPRVPRVCGGCSRIPSPSILRKCENVFLPQCSNETTRRPQLFCHNVATSTETSCLTTGLRRIEQHFCETQSQKAEMNTISLPNRNLRAVSPVLFHAWTDTPPLSDREMVWVFPARTDRAGGEPGKGPTGNPPPIAPYKLHTLYRISLPRERHAIG
jgi:hypothetical protein